jgi:hypothetical protein
MDALQPSFRFGPTCCVRVTEGTCLETSAARCIAHALPPGVAANAPEDLIGRRGVPGRLCLGSSGYGAAALPNAATMRPRTGLSTDDNVKKETRVNIVVRDAKRSACQGRRPLWDIGCCSA